MQLYLNVSSRHQPGVGTCTFFFTDFRNKLVFDPGKLMQSSLMFVGDERRLP